MFLAAKNKTSNSSRRQKTLHHILFQSDHAQESTPYLQHLANHDQKILWPVDATEAIDDPT